jgi:hypothetical protein
MDRGEPLSEGMTAARVAQLDALGFSWEVMHPGRKTPRS